MPVREEDGKVTVSIDISEGDSCPGVWLKATQSGINFCRVVSNDAFTCSSANFSTKGISYEKVCERDRGYQKNNTVGLF